MDVAVATPGRVVFPVCAFARSWIFEGYCEVEGSKGSLLFLRNKDVLVGRGMLTNELADLEHDLLMPHVLGERASECLDAITTFAADLQTDNLSEEMAFDPLYCISGAARCSFYIAVVLEEDLEARLYPLGVTSPLVVAGSLLGNFLAGLVRAWDGGEGCRRS